MSHGTIAERFAAWAHGVDLDAVPDPVIHVARRAIVDTLGVLVAGGKDDGVRKLAKTLPAGSGACRAVGGRLLRAEDAALLNGMAAHVLDFDDTSYTGIMHGSCVVLPVALSLVQEKRLSERDLLEAFIAGSEIAYTLAEISTHQHYFRGWWSTATFGLIGATVAAARLLGCSPTETTSAIGMAAVACGVGKAAFGTDGKPLLVGETCRRAITFARAASVGLTGPAEAFEDASGFVHLMNDGTADLERLATLGRRWRLVDPGLLIKTSPVCSAAHAAIEQMALLMRKIPRGAASIQTIEAEVPQLVADSLVYRIPHTPRQAQFSLPYAIACAALNGRVRLEDLTENAIGDQSKRALMERVETRVAPDLSTDVMRAKYPESARIVVTLADGQEIEGFCGSARGMPTRPLSDDEVLGKFEDCLVHAGSRVPKISFDSTDLVALADSILE
ncbi:MAG: MmgE/PrpD family protein [Pseudomonadota bacterium]